MSRSTRTVLWVAWLLSVGFAAYASGENGYRLGRSTDWFSSCTIAFSKDKTILQDHCNYSDGSDDLAWLRKMQTKYSEF